MMDGAAEDWVARTITAARKTAPVADGVSSLIEERLRGVMSERALRPTELKQLANALIKTATRPPDTAEDN